MAAESMGLILPSGFVWGLMALAVTIYLLSNIADKMRGRRG